ncbi:basic amino acid ABC transporter substrate-binding protein [Bacillus sp. AL-1R]
MKKVKKLSFAFAVTTALILSGCGKDAKTSGSAEKPLRVVTDAAYAPFEYLDNGKIVGFDVDFTNAVAKEAGFKIKIVNTGWDPLFAEIGGKTADIGMSSISINADREKTYDFTTPYFLSINKILVPEGSSIKSAADLKGKVVAVQNGTTGQEAVEKMYGKNNKNLKKFENNNLAILELLSGGADAVVADNGVIEAYAKNNPDKKLVVIDDKNSFEPEFYGLLLQDGSKLKGKLDKAIKEVVNNGTYEKIYKEHFGSEPDLETLKAEENK